MTRQDVAGGRAARPFEVEAGAADHGAVDTADDHVRAGAVPIPGMVAEPEEPARVVGRAMRGETEQTRDVGIAGVAKNLVHIIQRRTAQEEPVGLKPLGGSHCGPLKWRFACSVTRSMNAAFPRV